MLSAIRSLFLFNVNRYPFTSPFPSPMLHFSLYVFHSPVPNFTLFTLRFLEPLITPHRQLSFDMFHEFEHDGHDNEDRDTAESK